MNLEDDAPPPIAAPAPAPSSDELRRVEDARTMRALTHPVRIALLEQLTIVGPLTATEAGELIGESATTCSFHLRQLAKYGFVEEAGGGKGRARPWKMTSIGMTLSAIGADPETVVAQRALLSVVRERQLARYRGWTETQGAYPESWQRAATESEYLFHLTAEELRELNDQVHAILMARFRERLGDGVPRPAGSLPVEALFFSYPMHPPTAS